jgi:hypothetical protein
MGLEEPIVPEWRAGRLSIGYQEERDLLLLEAEELLPQDEVAESEAEAGEEEGEGEAGQELREEDLATLEAELEAELESGLETPTEVELEVERGRVRFWATREQMLSLARHGAAVCAAGRPRCQLCGNPIDPDGHQCPALNGHREQSGP